MIRRTLSRAVTALLVAGCMLGCSGSDDETGDSNTSADDAAVSNDLDPTPGEMLAALDGARSASGYAAQLSRLSAACGMTAIEVADLAVHASRNVAPAQAVDISISEMLDAIDENAGGAVGCDEIAVATITLMMG